jgi:hypothetical protein
VSLVDRDRQWFKSKQGVAAEETPREISFCTHKIRKDEPFIVQDALSDPRFCNGPLVTGEPHVRAYVGIPIRTPSGHNIGALCVMDTKAREISTEQINVLQDLTRVVVDELECTAASRGYPSPPLSNCPFRASALASPNESLSRFHHTQQFRGVAHMFVVDTSALLAVIVGIVAAFPAYSCMHRSGRGRARSAIAYLSGLAAGLLAAVVLFHVLQALALKLTFGGAAFAGAFFGPFCGLFWGAWVRKGRKKRKSMA